MSGGPVAMSRFVVASRMGFPAVIDTLLNRNAKFRYPGTEVKAAEGFNNGTLDPTHYWWEAEA